MNQRAAKELLEAAADLTVALRAWGFHLPHSVLAPKDADTSKPTGKNPLERIQKAILRCRRSEEREKRHKSRG